MGAPSTFHSQMGNVEVTRAGPRLYMFTIRPHGGGGGNNTPSAQTTLPSPPPSPAHQKPKPESVTIASPKAEHQQQQQQQSRLTIPIFTRTMYADPVAEPQFSASGGSFSLPRRPVSSSSSTGAQKLSAARAAKDKKDDKSRFTHLCVGPEYDEYIKATVLTRFARSVLHKSVRTEIEYPAVSPLLPHLFELSMRTAMRIVERQHIACLTHVLARSGGDESEAGDGAKDETWEERLARDEENVAVLEKWLQLEVDLGFLGERLVDVLATEKGDGQKDGKMEEQVREAKECLDHWDNIVRSMDELMEILLRDDGELRWLLRPVRSASE